MANVLVVTPRAAEPLLEANVTLDAVVYSAGDENEVAWAESLARLKPTYTVATRGSTGGTINLVTKTANMQDSAEFRAVGGSADYRRAINYILPLIETGNARAEEGLALAAGD